MSVFRQMLRMWVAPRATARAVVCAPPTEPQALATLMGGALLGFVAQWPGHARAAQMDPSTPLDARIGGAILGALFILPLVAYAIAGLTQLVAHLAGYRPEGVQMRMALFWALLAAGPAMLLAGLTRGFVGPGSALTLVNAAAGIGFVVFWASGLAAALKGKDKGYAVRTE